MTVRNAVIWLASISVGAIAIAAVWLGLELWAIDDVNQRIGAIGALAGSVAAVLALIAAVVAILAYAAATATPKLGLEVNFKGNQGPNVLAFQIDPDGTLAVGQINLEQNPQLVALTKLSNSASASARNPAVRLEFIGPGRVAEINGIPLNLGKDWEVVRPSNPDSGFAVQWMAGAI